MKNKGVTAKDVATYVKTMLGASPAWAQRAILKLHEFQTMHEQIAQSTSERNGVGFNGVDANILSSFAEQLKQGRSLSPKQMMIAFKALPKYSSQIIGCISEDKLEEIKNRISEKNLA